jgi:serine/threonine protein kinase
MKKNLNNPDDKKRLIELLFECPSLKEVDKRQSLLTLLPSHITDNIRIGNTTTEYIINIVDTCIKYSDGIEHLFNAIRLFDEKSEPFGALISEFNLDNLELGPKTPPPNIGNIEKTITALMAQLYLLPQMRASDEFTRHNKDSLQLIREAMVQLKQLSPQTPEYGRVSLSVGSALASTGELLQAERLFTQVIENTDNSAERALAHFNLFQVQLRGKVYPEALENLQAALELDKQRYALHNVDKYPIERLLGAGGMGCVFLCQNRNALIRHERVVVKCFWEHPQGTLEEAFKEPLNMHEIAGDYTPKPLEFDYFDGPKQERAYFVTEYIDDAIDGEVWLEKYGPMDLETGLPVGLQIAQGLQIAHDAGICHLDLKPANILLCPGPLPNPLPKGEGIPSPSGRGLGGGPKVKIIDFGLSQVVPSLQQKAKTVQQRQTRLSQLGQAIFGTLDYACPEQQGFTQYGKPGVLCDVFAFGTTMYRFFTGKNPRYFRERDLPKVEALRDLLGDCVDEEPKRRPESVQQLINQIEKIQGIEPRKAKELDEKAWQKACQQDTKSAYQTYLDGNTLKQYADDAQKRLQAIEKSEAEEQAKIVQRKTEEEKQRKARIAQQKAEKRQQDEIAQRKAEEEKQRQAEIAKQKTEQKSYRYIDNGNGTVTDNRTGLIWLKNANCFDRQNWEKAMQSAAQLADGQCGLSDGSKTGDWRLPTKEEWEAMIDKKYRPALSNAVGTDKWKESDAFSGVQTSFYWSSTSGADDSTNAWYVRLVYGLVDAGVKSSTNYVWPVRGGQ